MRSGRRALSGVVLAVGDVLLRAGTSSKRAAQCYTMASPSGRRHRPRRSQQRFLQNGSGDRRCHNMGSATAGGAGKLERHFRGLPRPKAFAITEVLRPPADAAIRRGKRGTCRCQHEGRDVLVRASRSRRTRTYRDGLAIAEANRAGRSRNTQVAARTSSYLQTG